MASGSYLIHEFLRLLYHQCDVLLRLTPLNVLFVRLTVSSKFQFKKIIIFLKIFHGLDFTELIIRTI